MDELLMNSLDDPSVLSDGWLGPFERKGRRLLQGKKHIRNLELPPVVCRLTCGHFHHLQCFSEVQKAFAALEAAIKFGNLSQVAADFNCCDSLKEHDDQVMFQFIKHFAAFALCLVIRHWL